MSYIIGNPLAVAWWLLGIVILLRWFNIIASDPNRQIGDSELGLSDERESVAERAEGSPQILASSH